MAGRRRTSVDAAYLERAALYYLERYASSAENLRRVLRRKIRVRSRDNPDGPPKQAEEWIEAVVEKLIRLKLLDDRSYAAGKVRSLYALGKPLGRIRQTLAAKGIRGEAADAALENLRQESKAVVSDLPAALAYARRRRIGPWRHDPETRAAMRQKDLGALARRGFSQDLAVRILKADTIADAEAMMDELTND